MWVARANQLEKCLIPLQFSSTSAGAAALRPVFKSEHALLKGSGLESWVKILAQEAKVPHSLYLPLEFTSGLYFWFPHSLPVWPWGYYFSILLSLSWSTRFTSCIGVDNQCKCIDTVMTRWRSESKLVTELEIKQRPLDLRINSFNLQATFAWINKGNNSSASGLNHFSDQVMCPSSVMITFVGSELQFPPACHLPNDFCPWEKEFKYDKDDNHN